MIKLFAENSRFRNFLIYQTFNSIGSGIFSIFMLWVVHALYQNPIYTGIAGFMFVAPRVGSFLVGPFVDKHSKIAIIRTTCFLRLCVVAALLAVSFAHVPGAWLFHLAILVFSVSTTVGAPAETALLPHIVDGNDLIKANALIRIMATIAGLCIGVGLYMMMAQSSGFMLVYAINAAMLLIALFFSVFMRGGDSEKSKESADTIASKPYFAELKAGLVVAKQGAMLYLVIAFVTLHLFAETAVVNLPMLADVHAGTASGYMLLMALALVGGVAGSYISRIIGPKLELWKIFVVGFIFTGIARIIFVNIIANDFTRSLWIYILYVGLGSAIIIFFQTFMQKFPPKHLIARVNTIVTSLCSIAAAIGALLGGLAGTYLSNVDMVFIIQGGSYIAIGLLLFLSKHVRELPKINDVVTS